MAAPAEVSALSAGGDVAGLRACYETANTLELRAATLSRQLEVGERNLVKAREEAKAALGRRKRAAAETPLCQRARKVALSSLEEAERALQVEFDAKTRKAKELQGLRRTLESLRQRREQAVVQSAEERAALAQVEESREALQVENSSLKETINSMEGLGLTLDRRIAAERDKRRRLKACVRIKVEQIDKDRAYLHQQVQDYEEKVREWTRRAAEQEQVAHKAREDLLEWRSQYERTERHIRQAREDKRAVQREYLELQRGHDKLRAELAEFQEKIATQAKGRLESHAIWRAKHLEKVDARVSARRAKDKEIEI